MSESPKEKEDGAEPKPRRKLPDAAICRAKPAGFGNYVNCLVELPVECKYSLPFGYEYFCLHPERMDIVAQTKP
jgi:hypothetical protein